MLSQGRWNAYSYGENNHLISAQVCARWAPIIPIHSLIITPDSTSPKRKLQEIEEDIIDNDDNVRTGFTHHPHTAFLIYPSRSHTHPNAHAHRPPLPACPLTAVSSHWACTPVPLAMLSFPHGRASVNMGGMLNQTKHVPLQWNTPLNDPFFLSLTPSNSFSTVGFSFHATPLSNPSCPDPHVSKNWLLLRCAIPRSWPLFSRW